MLILADHPIADVTALAARLARRGVSLLDARGLGLDIAAVRAHLAAAQHATSTWLVVPPQGVPIDEFAARVRRYDERVLAATRLNAADLGTLVADAVSVLDALPALPRLETERLVLGVPTHAQIEDYYDSIVGTDMFATILWEGPASPDDLYSYWHDCRQHTLDGLTAPLSVAIIDKATDRYIGGAALRPIAGNPEQIDIGYALAPHAHGRGFATEAVGRLVDEAFAVRGAERIIATVFVGNAASRNVTEKLGFRCEGVLRAAVRKRGVMRDEWMLAITRADWLARRTASN